jgi:hypothetical protein
MSSSSSSNALSRQKNIQKNRCSTVSSSIFLKAISDITSILLTLRAYSSSSFLSHTRTGGEDTEHCNLIMVYLVKRELWAPEPEQGDLPAGPGVAR